MVNIKIENFIMNFPWTSCSHSFLYPSATSLWSLGARAGLWMLCSPVLRVNWLVGRDWRRPRRGETWELFPSLFALVEPSAAAVVWLQLLLPFPPGWGQAALPASSVPPAGPWQLFSTVAYTWFASPCTSPFQPFLLLGSKVDLISIWFEYIKWFMFAPGWPQLPELYMPVVCNKKNPRQIQKAFYH